MITAKQTNYQYKQSFLVSVFLLEEEKYLNYYDKVRNQDLLVVFEEAIQFELIAEKERRDELIDYFQKGEKRE